MFYKKFEIRNFQGIESLEIDLKNNRILTLVGLNESGKTTILKSIDTLYKLVKGATLSAEELNQLRPKGIDFTGAIEIRAILELEKEDVQKIHGKWKALKKQSTLEFGNDFQVSFKFDFELHKFKETSNNIIFDLKVLTKKGLKPRLHSHDNSGWNTLMLYIEKELIPEILFYEDFFFEIPEKIEFQVNAGEDVVYQPSMKNWQLVLDDILKVVNEKLSFQKDVVDIWTTDNDLASNRVSKVEGLMNEKITEAWKALFQKESKKLNFKEIRLKCDMEGKIFKVAFQIRTDSDKIFSINERSKGCKWFFSFLLFTEFRKSRTKNILFLLDEPASNLHSSAQAKILEAIHALSDKSIVIYSTHSHHLVKVEWLSGAYVVVNDLVSKNHLSGDMDFEEKSKITATKYFKYVGMGLGSDKVSYFQPILDALEYKPSAVEPIPEIIICEGKNDWYTLRYFEEVIFKKNKTKNFYPGAGANKLFDIIRIYLSWGRPFFVLLDDDAAGKEALSEYRKIFGPILDGKIATLSGLL
jgi:predicted ATP-dependent endonuclease of OLD family